MKVSYVLDKEERSKRMEIQGQSSPKAIQSLTFTSDDESQAKSIFETWKQISYKAIAGVYANNLEMLWDQMGRCNVGRILSEKEVELIDRLDYHLITTSMVQLMERLGIQSSSDIFLLIHNSHYKIRNAFLALIFVRTAYPYSHTYVQVSR